MTDSAPRDTAAREPRRRSPLAGRGRARDGALEATFAGRHSFARSAASVWRLLAQLDNPDLAKGFSKIAVEGVGEGAIRSLWLGEGPGPRVIRERIESFDGRGRAYDYRVFEFGPMPFAAYTGRLRVKSTGTACQLLYRARFVRSASISAEEARRIVSGSFARLCANIADALR